MTIEWNKVTWYSKLLAVIVGLATIVLGFYFVREFKEVNKQLELQKSEIKYLSGEVQKNSTINVSLGSSDWKIYRNNVFGFVIKYPPNWKIMNTIEGGPIVAFAPSDYNFRDGTDAPYGFFIIDMFGKNLTPEFKAELLKKPLDSGWREGDFGTDRLVITSDHKLSIHMIGGENVELRSIQDKILESFGFLNTRD